MGENPKSNKAAWTDGQYALIEEWLISKWGKDKPCPFCGLPQLAIGPSPAIVANYTGSTVMLGGGYPCIMLVCTNCAYTAMVNAFAAGVLEPPKKKEAKDA